MHYALFLIIVLFFTACTDENSASDRNESNFSPKTSNVFSTEFDKNEMLQNIYTSVLLVDVKAFKSTLLILQEKIKNLQTTPTQTLLDETQFAWIDTLSVWKRVQGNWIEDEILSTNGIDEILNLIDQSDFVNPSKKKPSFYAQELLNGFDEVSTKSFSARERTLFILENLLFDANGSDDFIN